MTYGAQKKLVKALGAEQTPVNLIKLAQDEVWLGTKYPLNVVIFLPK